MIETATANGLDAYGYLKFIIERLPLAENIEEVEALLPWEIKNEQLAVWDRFN